VVVGEELLPNGGPCSLALVLAGWQLDLLSPLLSSEERLWLLDVALKGASLFSNERRFRNVVNTMEETCGRRLHGEPKASGTDAGGGLTILRKMFFRFFCENVCLLLVWLGKV
jgi:hypothetical protein